MVFIVFIAAADAGGCGAVREMASGAFVSPPLPGVRRHRAAGRGVDLSVLYFFIISGKITDMQEMRKRGIQ